MWFEECFPRGETRAFAGAVKEAMAYAEVKLKGVKSRRRNCRLSVRPALVIVHDNMIIPAETHHESRCTHARSPADNGAEPHDGGTSTMTM